MIKSCICIDSQCPQHPEKNYCVGVEGVAGNGYCTQCDMYRQNKHFSSDQPVSDENIY